MLSVANFGHLAEKPSEKIIIQLSSKIGLYAPTQKVVCVKKTYTRSYHEIIFDKKINAVILKTKVENPLFCSIKKGKKIYQKMEIVVKRYESSIDLELVESVLNKHTQTPAPLNRDFSG